MRFDLQSQRQYSNQHLLFASDYQQFFSFLLFLYLSLSVWFGQWYISLCQAWALSRASWVLFGTPRPPSPTIHYMYTDHHFTVISLQTCVLCVCLVIISTLFYLYACTVVMLCIQIISLLQYTFRIVYSVFVLLLLLHCFIFILVLLLCHVSRSSLYCNIPSDFERQSWPRSYGSCIYNYLCKSVPITTDFVNSNLDQGEVYNIM